MEPSWLDIYFQALDMQAQMTLPLANLMQPVPYAPPTDQPIMVGSTPQQPGQPVPTTTQQPVNQDVSGTQGNLNQMTSTGVPNG